MQAWLQKYFKNMQDNLEIGKRLKEARERKSLNKSELAKMAKTSGTSINNIEKGETKNPSSGLLAKIASVLEIDLTWLLHGDKAGISVGAGVLGSNNTQLHGNKSQIGADAKVLKDEIESLKNTLARLESEVARKDKEIERKDKDIEKLERKLEQAEREAGDK